MNKTEAAKLRADWNADVKALTRQTKAKLEQIYAHRLGEQGMTRLYGRSSKDELVNEILDLRYPREKLNEAIHVVHHQEIWPDCEWCVPGLAGHTAAACDTIAQASR